MATDFWSSTHYRRWIVDRASLRKARSMDLLYVDDPDHLALIGIFLVDALAKLGQKIGLRQRVIATASVFLRRFYLKNSYCETDPFLVIAACCYLAAKAEESPVHIRNVVAEARTAFGEYGAKIPSDNTKLAEMEFYLVDDLECDLTVFHPYRALVNLIKPTLETEGIEKEAGELGVGVDDGPRYWGTGEGRLVIGNGGVQLAWFLINDTYRSDICLMYPPHMIALASLYLVCVLNPATRKGHLEWVELQERLATSAAAQSTAPSTRRSSRHSNPTPSTNTSLSTDVSGAHTANSSSAGTAGGQSQPRGANGANNVPPQDFIGFWASLNVSMPTVALIAQEMLSFYALCGRLEGNSGGPPGTEGQSQGNGRPRTSTRTGSKRTIAARNDNGSISTPSEIAAMRDNISVKDGETSEKKITTAFLMQLLLKMRAMREADVAHPSTGRPVAVNRVLERTQAAG